VSGERERHVRYNAPRGAATRERARRHAAARRRAREERMREQDVALREAVLRLNARAWGIALGLLLGGGLFVATNILVLKGGHPVGPHLALLSVFFPGYRVTFLGSLIGFVYMFVVGYALGRFIGMVYNRLVGPAS
jgi:hypothetical protein